MIHEPVTETRSEERPRAGGVRLAVWLGVIGLLVALNYYGRYLYESEGSTADNRDALYEWATFAGALVQFGLLLGFVLVLVAGLPARDLLALRRPASWGRALGLGVLVFVGTYVVAFVLSRLGADPGAEQGLTPEGWDASRAAPFVANAIVVAGLVPVVEELLFRGIGFSLLARYGAPVAIVATGVLFALGHGVLYGLPIFVFLGLGLAYIRWRSGSIYPTIVFHASFNAIALAAAVSLGGRS
jgi:membrane protease YdiL (CAAX protease family)